MITFNNKVVTYNHKWINGSGTPVDPYNPLGLPPNTVRVRTNDGNVPKKGTSTRYDSATLVPGTTDVYDVFKDDQSFQFLLSGSDNVVEVLGANTTGITIMYYMFQGCPSLTNIPLFDTSSVTNMDSMFGNCTSLTTVPLFDTSNVRDMDNMFGSCISLQSVPLFDTSNVTTMECMFYKCTSLTSVPLFDTSNATSISYMFYNCTSLNNIPLFNTIKVTNMDYMFYNCKLVQSGALALYQQASTQTNPPSNHECTFYNCGSNTQTGAAELAQIPSDWKKYEQ